MAKPEPWRLSLVGYPQTLDVPTRFQDMDVNGHLNNVAFAALFENARVMLNRQVRVWNERPANERTMVAAVTINYLAEGNYPDPVIVASGIGHVGTSSWTILQGMFQNGHCIATCDTVVVARTDNQAKPLRAALREGLESMMVRSE